MKQFRKALMEDVKKLESYLEKYSYSSTPVVSYQNGNIQITDKCNDSYEASFEATLLAKFEKLNKLMY